MTKNKVTNKGVSSMCYFWPTVQEQRPALLSCLPDAHAHPQDDEEHCGSIATFEMSAVAGG